MGVMWTEEQQKVISLRDRNILVSAAAGSGKTAVLVQRILSKVLDPERPVDIDRLLIMTFTRAAAGEMKERISAAIDQALFEHPEHEHLQRQATLIHNAQITTIDGFCAYIIRNYFHMIELDPGYRTAEEGELKLLREDVMKEVLEDAYAKKNEKFLNLVECYATGKTDDEIRDMIYKLYDASMSHPFPEEWLEECLQVYRVDTLEELRKTVWMDLIWEAAQESIAQIREFLSRATGICREEGGPYFYETALEDDILLLRAVEALAEERDYDRLSEMLRNHKYARLSTRKDPAVDEEKKAQVKDLRDSEKELWNELEEKYFNQTEEKILEYLQYCRIPMEGLTEITLQFKEAFAAKKREKNLLDFTDMEHFALEILMHREGDTVTPSAAARELSSRYDEVMVDEYQDSNLVQEMITNLVSGWADKRKNIFMVGDVKQSIYRFRLARPELFMEKYHSYSLEDSKEQRIDLHKNFRSRKEVLASVNYLFRQIMGEDLGGIAYDDENALYAGASFPEREDRKEPETEVLLIEKDGEELEEQGNQTIQELEALAIAQRIQKLVGTEEVLDKETGTYRKAGYGDIVILLRTSTGWAEPFSQVLAAKGIPVYTASRTGYFSAQEVVTVLNYLRVCDNPLQDIPLTGVLHSPIVGCSAQELAMIRSTCPDGMLYESLQAYCEREAQTEEEILLKEKTGHFLEQLEKMRDRSVYTPVHELIQMILVETGYGNYVRAIPGGAQRGANLHMLVEKAMDYEKTSYRGLFNFVRYIEKLQKYEVDFGEVNLADAGSGAVQIMTIHKSKGLEFPIVFAAGMGKQFNFQDINNRFLIHPDMGFGVDVILPEKRLILATVHKQIIRRQLKRESLGEELRVLYVALTRAKEKLIITGTLGKIADVLTAVSWQMRRRETLLPIGTRGEARSYWSYILPALARHEAMLPLFREYGITERPFPVCEMEDARFVVHKVTVAELVQGEILDQTDSQMQEKLLKEWDSSRIYEKEIHEILAERFSFQYPYDYLKELPVKVSVSELKKRSWQGEAEKEEAVFYETDVEEIIPAFISGVKEEYRGAARGTAYHRLMECLDYANAENARQIQKQIRQLVDTKKMSQEEAECIRISDVLEFVDSEVGQRMKAAAERNALYREQPFVIAQKMKQIETGWNGEETVLVQGIIDAYFIEDEEIVLVDYKTDKVSPSGEQHLVDLYHTQLEDYGAALERMLQKNVKETYIYSFTLGKMIQL
ncbi:helicase-exonuclease AddAB subunit AddA [Blautia sp. MSJ-19]|uniref:helicase-exonuclease AddAB subunit AddA n=1 Tax=Blautia sp. MSJ-19 TaxID=2841517 RepID=UPI001C0ECB13|nr:helicase-exonuclease AddAB subunit AddA [Blautia sp. MSJ-19]MBU5481179.1 helicase-exonuclease AddAB subunit AddA [Blautia sp. MSJ-19]